MKKNIKRIIIFLSGIVALIVIFSSIKYSPEYMYRVFKYGESDVNDYKIFPERIIQHSANPYYYKVKPTNGLEDHKISYTYNGKAHEKGLSLFLEENNSTAFMVVHNDNIVFEQYYNGYNRNSINTSFSSVKSIGSLLIGIAIDEGYIESEAQSIADYISELKDTAFEDITIKDLLLMRSNIQYEEGGLWFGDDAKTYYLPDLRELAINQIKINQGYEGSFHYNNYHPLLLGIILERSTGQSVSGFLEEKLWKKLGTEYNASWSLDSNKSGFEKMESGLNFRTIDFIKVGSMLLNKGKWNGEEIVSEDWINKSLIAPFPINNEEYKNSGLWDTGIGYQYMWYSFENKKGSHDIFAYGKFGQILYISPENNIVIARNGINEGEIDWKVWVNVLRDVADAIGNK